jgi:hypothetical protein
MRGVDISDVTPPIDSMFLPPFLEGENVTIGIGDGGNEIGLGLPAIEDRVIACTVPTTVAIATGVSNWGGYALAAGLAVLANNPALAASAAHDAAAMAAVNAVGGVDGVRGKVSMSVDDLDWDDVHRPMLNTLEAVAVSALNQTRL